ncbi:hypothetical protein V4886_25120, partial [Ralstonia solanacearum species complex bacterium RW470]
MKRLTALVLIPVLAGCVSAVSERVSANYTRHGDPGDAHITWTCGAMDANAPPVRQADAAAPLSAAREAPIR